MDYYFDDWGTGSDMYVPDQIYYDDWGVGSTDSGDMAGNWEPIYTDDWGPSANLADTAFPTSAPVEEGFSLSGSLKGVGEMLKNAGLIEYNKNGEWRMSPLASILMAGGKLGLSQLMDKQKAKAAEKLVKRNYDLAYDQYKKQKADEIASIPQLAQASRAAQYKPNVLPYNAQFGTPQYQQVPGLLKL